MHNNNNHIYQYNGFLLIDLVISIGIFSVFCLSVAQMNYQIIKQEKEIRVYREAINVVNNIIEEIHSTKVYKPQSIKTGTFMINIENMPNFYTSKKSAVKLQALRVSINWKTERDNKISIITAVII